MTAVSGVTQTGATSGGNVTSDGNATVTARGVVWGTAANPTISDSKTSDGSGTGAFTSALSGLTRNTVYHVRAYATNSVGTTYTADTTFTTLADLPTVTTTAASGMTRTAASAGGNVTDDGGGTITARGTAWSTSANPTISGSVTSDGTGTGAFASSLTGLTAGTTYHIRAYATNSDGTAYGSDVTLATLSPSVPTVALTGAGSITKSSATSGGTVTDDGGATVASRGVVWSTSANPTTADSLTSDGSGTGSFTSSLTGLTRATTYYLRAYASNSAGTGYSAGATFTTLADVPTVTTAAASNVTGSSGQAGGSVSDNGGATISDFGVVWSATNSTPTISDSKVAGTGVSGSFVANLSGLSNKTTYYVRAYATNSAGTGYGAVVTLATLNQYNLPASVSPLISNQWLVFTWPYNAYYPVDTNSADSNNTNDGHVGNACGPTSLTKTLAYWKVATGSGKIDADDDTLSGIHWTFDLSAMSIDYSNMPDTLAITATEAQYKDVATLFEAAGAVGFTHGIGGGSVADTLYPSMAPYFNMSPAVHVEHDWEYTADDWTHLVEYELSKGRPLIVAGRTAASNDPWTGGGAAGHWWNVDGYNSSDQIHATYNFNDYSGNPIAGYYGTDSMGPLTFDSGQWAAYTKDHYVVFDFQPQIASTASPVVETYPANNPTQTTVRLSGDVVGAGSATLTARGFHVEAISGATTAAYDVEAGNGEGHFYTSLTGLTPGATYQVTAYADSASQRYTGEAQQFTTLASSVTPTDVMPLLPDRWLVNTYPYNAGLPAYASGPGGYFYNEQGATALARLLHYWRSPANGTGTFNASMNWNGTDLTLIADLSSLNLDYGKMVNQLSSTATSDQYSEVAKLVAAAEIFGFGTTGTGNGSLRTTDPDAYVVPNLIAAWGLDSGLTLVKQENYTATDWANLLKTEIAAGRPVMVIGRTTASVAPGVSGTVNAGWYLIDGYNSSGQFHVDAGGVAFDVPDSRGWYDPALLAPTDGYTSYHRALIGFKPASN